jgi:hypothetical protein
VINARAVPVYYTDEGLLDLVLGLVDKDGGLSYQFYPLLFLTKSMDWAEEREWRIVDLGYRPDDDQWRRLHFLPSNVRRIFLGGRMAEEKRAELRELAKSHGWTVLEMAYCTETGAVNWEGVEQVQSREDLEFWQNVFRRRREQDQ